MSTPASVPSVLPGGVTELALKQAFKLAEAQLRGAMNGPIAAMIADEAGTVRYESLLNELFRAALAEAFPRCSAETELNRIDLCLVANGKVVVACECKGMVSNSHQGDRMADSLDVHGIRTKLRPSHRSTNCLRTDLTALTRKIPQTMRGDHYQLFVPVVYELYRTGGEDEWLKERKPWVTQPGYRGKRDRLARDLLDWFHGYAPECRHLHSTPSIRLEGADAVWKAKSRAAYPRFCSLDAYVSFHVFWRPVPSSAFRGEP